MFDSVSFEAGEQRKVVPSSSPHKDTACRSTTHPVTDSRRRTHKNASDSSDDGEDIPVIPAGDNMDDTYSYSYSDDDNHVRIATSVFDGKQAPKKPKPPDGVLVHRPRPPMRPVPPTAPPNGPPKIQRWSRGMVAKMEEKDSEEKETDAYVVVKRDTMKTVNEEQGEEEEKEKTVMMPTSLPHPTIAENRISYHIAKDRKLGLGCVKLTFSLLSGGRKEGTIAFVSGAKSAEMEVGDFKGVLMMEKREHMFSLRRESDTGIEVCTIRYQPADSDPSIRFCKLYLFEKSGELPTLMTSRKPSVNSMGEKTLAFGKRRVVPSMKNCILVDSDNVEVIAVMKNSNTMLCIDVCHSILPHVAFAVGVSSFICGKP